MLRVEMAAALPTNRAPFTLAEVLAATGGRLVRDGVAAEKAGGLGRAPSGLGTSCVGVSTDTRTLAEGQAFVALVGPRFDGHDHLETAARAGASILVVSREAHVLPGPAIVRVDDGVKALGDLARAHRRRWARSRSAKSRRWVVAITGSAGKTTTRRVATRLLAASGFSVHATAENLNNQIGVPLTLLGLDDGHDIAVVEIGTNLRGEIATNTAVAEPDVGVLTLVADAHGEGLGSAWAIAVEKGDLLAALPRDGIAIANGDDARSTAQLLRSPASTWVTYGEDPSCDVALVARQVRGAAGQHLSLRILGRHPVVRPLLDVDVALLGKAGVSAVLAAAAIVDAVSAVGCPTSEVASAALSDPSIREPGRLSPVVVDGGMIVIDDSYNANPASMIASVDAAREVARAEERSLVLVLGEMYELGAESEALHERVGRVAALARPREMICVKGEAVRYHEAAKRYAVPSTLVADADAAIAEAKRRVGRGDVVLVKGSNGVGLARVAAALRGGAS
jgi:UDP-N-acetylmuramoyl-tripeptide--D-alanyl-D-alanine ligase